MDDEFTSATFGITIRVVKPDGETFPMLISREAYYDLLASGYFEEAAKPLINGRFVPTVKILGLID